MIEQELNELVVAQLRRRARDGATPVQLIEHIRLATNTNERGMGRILVVAYMRRAFELPFIEAVSLGAWVGLGYGDGHLSDTEVNTNLERFLARYRSS